MFSYENIFYTVQMVVEEKNEYHREDLSALTHLLFLVVVLSNISCSYLFFDHRSTFSTKTR